MAPLTEDEVRRWRAHAQGLYGDAAGARTVLDAVRLSGGLQAQDAKACRLQVWARTRPADAAGTSAAGAAPTAADVDAACGADRREVVRTWLMRGTLHAVAAGDARWLTALLGPRVADSYRGRRQRLGLDEDLCARALPVLEKVLAGCAPVTRDELVRRLAAAGVAVDPRGQAAAHLVLYAAARGVLCRGPETAGDSSTYVLREEWLEHVPDTGPRGDEALAELAVRHATAYGPASAADLARWSGLPLGSARRGQAAAGDRLTEVAGPAGPLVTATGTGPPPPAADRVRLTGHFDPYLLGYADRDLLLAPAIAPRIATGGGFLMPCVLVDGAVVATWRHERRADHLTLRVEPLPTPTPPPDLTEPLTTATTDLARFLDVPTRWEWTEEA
ncbi:winged helix DNA-binding domain-containing protein [Streptomyces sp. NPDC051976]|uniref:winged helix DNA-binding domain-containing protein n=1 Tax=Streptomyces sp. NPDC051976 TaxID=3154947 RepID=UPI0034394BE9